MRRWLEGVGTRDPPGGQHGFSRQDYWNGLPSPPPRDLSNPGIEPMSLTSPALVGWFFTTNTTWEAQEAVRNTYEGSFTAKGSEACGLPGCYDRWAQS